jgi:L-asparaginase II
MSNPVLVEVTRGALVESRHRGAVAVADADGNRVFAVGDVDAPVYPRSAVKALQALVLVESGAADRFGFGDEELALACASHAGEPAHVTGVARMLERAGLDANALQCGTHSPINKQAADALIRAGREPSPLHHNCSGKHAGFLCAACASSTDPATYTQASHPVQREVRAAFEALSGCAIPDGWIGIDGCSVPTFGLPLAGLAQAFARFATGQTLPPVRAAAAKRLRAAVAARPWFVSGTGMYGAEIMERFGARVFVKSGAEAAYCAALPEHGLGIAVKCDDGGARAAETITAAVIAKFLPAGDRAALDPYVHHTLRNWRGLAVGEVRPTELLR